MRFGAFIPQGWRHDLVGVPVEDQWPTMLDVAKDIERLGYESAWVYDHFHPVPVADQEVPAEQHAPSVPQLGDEHVVGLRGPRSVRGVEPTG